MTTKSHSKRSPALTVEQAQRVREWAKMGTSIREVAAKHGVTRQCLHRYLRDEVKTHWRGNTT